MVYKSWNEKWERVFYYTMAFVHRPGRVYNHANSPGDEMKAILYTVGILLILAGGIFFLQGINILPGSFMTGDPQWAVNGGVMIVIAVGLLLWANRRR